MNTTTMPADTKHDTQSKSALARMATLVAGMIAAVLAAGFFLNPPVAQANPWHDHTGHNPWGHVEFSVTGNGVRVSGYAFDPDTWEPVTVVYLVNGTQRATDQTWWGSFDRELSLQQGTSEVQVVARNVGDGTSDTVIGSTTVQLTDPATHNPRGIARITHQARTLYVRGYTVDPDEPTWPLLVRVFDNGHVIASTRSNGETHWYAVRAHLRTGVNRIRVVSYNVGPGTANKVNGEATLWIPRAPRPKPKPPAPHPKPHPKPKPPAPHPKPKPKPPAGHDAPWMLQYQGYKRTAARMLPKYGWGAVQMTYLVKLWTRESGWNPRALNRSSGAYGIPQSLPAKKMASAGADWRTNATTQIRWGLGYIKNRYGSPQQAWAHEGRYNWYGR